MYVYVHMYMYICAYSVCVVGIDEVRQLMDIRGQIFKTTP